MKRLLLLCLFLMLFVTNFAIAETSEKKFNDRKGFFIGFGPGTGFEFNEFKNEHLDLDFRIGGGINNQFLLFYNVISNVLFETVDNDYPSISGSSLGAQYFLNSDDSSPYLFGCIGAGIVTDDFENNKLSQKNGFNAGLGVGYEFRRSKSFVLQPELDFYYFNVNDRQYPSISLMLNLMWYL